MLKGKTLEKRLNKVNLGYRKSRDAVITKIATPIEMTSMGLVVKMSTVDYIGVNKGEAIAFDAKECKSKTSFPLSNIKEHQLIFMEYWEAAYGTAFFLIQLTSLYENEAFKVPIEFIRHWWDSEERKSIPINEFDVEWLVNIDNYLEIKPKINK